MHHVAVASRWNLIPLSHFWRWMHLISIYWECAMLSKWHLSHCLKGQQPGRVPMSQLGTDVLFSGFWLFPHTMNYQWDRITSHIPFSGYMMLLGEIPTYLPWLNIIWYSSVMKLMPSFLIVFSCSLRVSYNVFQSYSQCTNSFQFLIPFHT